VGQTGGTSDAGESGLLLCAALSLIELCTGKIDFSQFARMML
jgi:hypothetical protein